MRARALDDPQIEEQIDMHRQGVIHRHADNETEIKLMKNPEKKNKCTEKEISR